jgi:hypothetical protein
MVGGDQPYWWATSLICGWTGGSGKVDVMATFDEEDHARSGRVEVVLHYAEKRDYNRALAIAFGEERELREGLIELINAMRARDEAERDDVRRSAEVRSKRHDLITAGPVPEATRLHPQQAGAMSLLPDAQQQSAMEQWQPTGYTPSAVAFRNRTLIDRLGQMVVWGLFKGAEPAIVDEETGLTDQEQQVIDEYGHRAAVSLVLGAVVMLAYLLWTVTGPWRGASIGSAYHILGTEISIALLTIFLWSVLLLVRRWAVSQYWHRS